MIVVTGATGNVGRTLVQALADADEKVTAISRRPSEQDLPQGVVHRQADLADADSLRPVLQDADALFLMVASDNPEEILEAARAGGVQRVVLLSSLGAGTRPESYPHPVSFENAVRQSGLDWMILRPGGFDSNAFLWAQSVRTERTVAAPFPDVALPSIDPADIGEVAATILRKPDYARQILALTGPVPITPRQQTAALADALGAPVQFVEQTRAEAKAHLLQFMPEPIIDSTLGILGDPTEIERAVSPSVEQILGRAPRTFAEWAERNIAAFS
jgi:uncharacterized protein YbjT (DUF2867 family)